MGSGPCSGMAHAPIAVILGRPRQSQPEPAKACERFRPDLLLFSHADLVRNAQLAAAQATLPRTTRESSATAALDPVFATTGAPIYGVSAASRCQRAIHAKFGRPGHCPQFTDNSAYCELPEAPDLALDMMAQSM